MRPYFIDTVSNWVSMQYNAQNYLEKVGKAFGEDYMKVSSRMTSGYVKCFEDFLLFEHKPIFFYYKTGLEYFVKYNPQNLDREIIAEYKEILETAVAGVFELKRQAMGLGLELYSKDTGIIFVYDEENFDSYEPGQLLWARVAKVNGNYYFVNDYVTPLWPVTSIDKNLVIKPLTVQQVAILAFADSETVHKNERERNKLLEKLLEQSFTEYRKINTESLEDREERVYNFEKNLTPDNQLENLEKKFENFRKKHGIGHLFTLDTFNEWICSAGDEDLDFAFRSLVFLVPEDFLENSDNHEKYIELGQNYINAFIKEKGLDKQTNIFLDMNILETKSKFLAKAYSWRDYQHMQYLGQKHLKEGKLKESKDNYTKLVEKLLQDKVLYWPIFRIFANASSVFFKSGELFMAMSLVEASLRLNPKYDFAKRLKLKYLQSVNSKKISKEYLDQFYKDSVFVRYEEFLTASGVNLNKKVTFKIKVFETE